MKDVDRSKLYDTAKQVPQEPAPDPTDPQKELLVLQSRLEKASGEDRARIQEQIQGITDKLKKDQSLPPTA